MAEPTATVEVVYASASEQRLVRIAWQPCMTAAQAVERSGLLDVFPEIRTRPLVLGVYGERVPPERPLEPGERVEICRPLQRDPREARRILARRGRVMGGSQSASGR